MTSTIFKFRIEKIKLLKFENLLDESVKVIKKDKLAFKVTLSFSIQPKKEIIGFKLNLSYEEKSTNKIYCNAIILVEFHIPEFEKQVLLDSDSNNYNIPDGFFLDAVSITVGTARGILYSKLEKTKLANFFVPIIDPVVFLQDLKNSIEGKKA